MRRPYHPTRARARAAERRGHPLTAALIILVPWLALMAALVAYGHATPTAAGVVLTLIAALSVLGAFLAYAAKDN